MVKPFWPSLGAGTRPGIASRPLPSSTMLVGTKCRLATLGSVDRQVCRL